MILWAAKARFKTKRLPRDLLRQSLKSPAIVNGAHLKGILTRNSTSLKVLGGSDVHIPVRKGGTIQARTTILRVDTMLRISFLAILLLTGCENKPDQVTVGQNQQIESPLQNTAEGMAKAKPKNSTGTAVSAVSRAGISGAAAGPVQAIR